MSGQQVVCQVCGDIIVDLSKTKVAYCGNCNTPHHLDCWEYTGACSVFACGAKHYKGVNPPSRMFFGLDVVPPGNSDGDEFLVTLFKFLCIMAIIFFGFILVVVLVKGKATELEKSHTVEVEKAHAVDEGKAVVLTFNLDSSHEVAVNYDKKLRDIARDNHCSGVGNEIDLRIVCQSPIEHSGKSKVIIDLIGFKKDVKSDEVWDCLEANSYRPANVFELMYLVGHCSDAHSLYVVSLNPSGGGGTDCRPTSSCYVAISGSNSIFHWATFKLEWPTMYRFAVVKKN